MDAFKVTASSPGLKNATWKVHSFFFFFSFLNKFYSVGIYLREAINSGLRKERDLYRSG